MEVITEGNICKSWDMKNVLQTIFEVENLAYGILRVNESAELGGLAGRVLIVDSKFIVGAYLAPRSNKPSENEAYNNLCKLLSVKEGNYAFLNAGSEKPLSFDQSLFIELKRVIDSLPEIPETQENLFAQNLLLDKLFGQVNCHEKSEAKQIAEVYLSSQEIVQKAQSELNPQLAWQVLEPLYTGDSELIKNEKSNLTKLRNMSTSGVAKAEFGMSTISRKTYIFNLIAIFLICALTSYVLPRMLAMVVIGSSKMNKTNIRTAAKTTNSVRQ